jgi:hypothetical protein
LIFVLIPGAGTDPRVYGATIAALRELGHEGIAPPLPLEDEEAAPSDHAEARPGVRIRFAQALARAVEVSPADR